MSTLAQLNGDIYHSLTGAWCVQLEGKALSNPATLKMMNEYAPTPYISGSCESAGFDV